MTRLKLWCLSLGACLLVCPAWVTGHSLSLEIEAGPAWQSRNEVQIPNNASGSRFSLVDVAGSGPVPAWRAYFTWAPGDRHELRALFAPLTLDESGTLAGETGFAGSTFSAGEATRAIYKFNSYRLTYRYRLVDNDSWRTWVGFTGKIRDAKVRLEQAGVAAQDTDVGFVPLLHVRVVRKLGEGWEATLDLDALAGGPGRAEDLALKLSRRLGTNWRISAGYRTLEGGADVDQVYNFAWFHYAVVSAQYRLY